MWSEMMALLRNVANAQWKKATEWNAWSLNWPKKIDAGHSGGNQQQQQRLAKKYNTKNTLAHDEVWRSNKFTFFLFSYSKFGETTQNYNLNYSLNAFLFLLSFSLSLFHSAIENCVYVVPVHGILSVVCRVFKARIISSDLLFFFLFSYLLFSL